MQAAFQKQGSLLPRRQAAAAPRPRVQLAALPFSRAAAGTLAAVVLLASGENRMGQIRVG